MQRAEAGQLPPRRSRVYLRPPRSDDEAAFLELVRGSRRLHRPWVYPPSDAAGFRHYLDRFQDPRQRGFLVWQMEDDALVGAIHFSEIVRAGFQNAYLGFFGGQELTGRGLMREGLEIALGRAFGEIGLHRLEANVQPDNPRSRALVIRLGFRLEGYSPRYLKIGGRWKDHERWALLAEEWRGRRRAANRP